MVTSTLETYVLCRFHGCTELGAVIVVTFDGFCFERCPAHARQIVSPI